MTSAPASMTLIEQRVIRVFVSSTFRDMYEEREELVKRVFPRLRKLCEQRGVTWAEVDLRWGITEEQSESGKVLPICLAEIQRCRPFFVGLLGERYGWVPDEIPQELLEQEPWLAEHLHHSVTELEILHGVLNDPAMTGHASFYFRDRSFIDSLQNEQQSYYLELPTEEEIAKYGQGEAQRRAEERRQKLVALKDRIRASGLRLRENYTNARALGEMVLSDLTEIINRLYPQGSEPLPLDREAFDQEAFAQSRAKVYIGRRDYYDRLDEHAGGDGPPLVVLGESGSGKSALLCNWALRYRGDQQPGPEPEKKSLWRKLTNALRLTSPSPDQPLLLMHFIGATPYSGDWTAMLRRIMGEFKRRFGIGQEIPDQPDALRAAFTNWLHIVAAKGRVILILDALNQLEDRDAAPDLVWLPPVIPSGIRLILSTLPGRALDDLKRRGWPTMQIEPLTVDERKQLIPAYLYQYAKQLSPARVERIACAEQTVNPLFLRALLDELRLFGIHEELDMRIEHYLTASTVDNLYERILERYEQDYEQGCDGLVSEAMSLLWAARRGLSEAELLEMLGTYRQPLPRADWSALYLAAESSLVSRSGLIGFSHDFLRQGVRTRYLCSDQDRQSAHLRLADYFETRDLGPRKVDELPWQLAQAKSWSRLSAKLGDLPFFNRAWDSSQFEVRAYWAEVESNSPFRLMDAYHPVLNAPADHRDHVWKVASLLQVMGHLDAAWGLRDYLTEQNLEGKNQWELQASLGNQAVIMINQGMLDEAMTLFKEQEHICRDLGYKLGLQACLSNQGIVGYRRGDLDRAMTLFQKAERICREMDFKSELQSCLCNQANVMTVRRDLKRAMGVLGEQERICRELGDRSSLAACLGNQALILKDQGDLDGARSLHIEEERICRELGDKEGLQRTLNNQALILKAQGYPDQAMGLLKESERICRDIGDTHGLSAALGNEANILYMKGDHDGAMTLYKEEERICRELLNKDGLQRSLGNQAMVLLRQKDFDGAMSLLKEKEHICRELKDPGELAVALGNQALVLAMQHRKNEALSLAQEAYTLIAKHGLVTRTQHMQKILDSIRSLPG